MATRTRTIKGIVTTITQIKTNGQVTVQRSYSNAMSYLDRAKETHKEPPFIPNVFNVKPYAVRHFQTNDEPFKCVYRTTRPSDGLRTITTIEGSGGMMEVLFDFMDRSLPDYSSELDLAMQEAYGKVSSAVWDVGVDLAELGELKGLEPSLTKGPRNWTDLAHELIDCLKKHEIEDARELKNVHDVYESEKAKRSTRRDVKTRASGIPKELANAWLVYRYGLMPTLLSINDALEFLRKKLELASGIIHTKRRRREFEKKETSLATSQKLVSITYDVRSRVEAIVYYRRVWDQNTLDLLGLNFGNIPSILWETTRLSFVWDWILHISDFLNGLRPKPDVQILGYTGSIKHDVNNTLTQCFNIWDATLSKYVPVPTTPVTYSGKSFTRVLDGGPKPYPIFTGASHMNMSRTFDALALALNPIAKKIRKYRLV